MTNRIIVTVRGTREQHEKFKQAAAKDEMSMNAWAIKCMEKCMSLDNCWCSKVDIPDYRIYGSDGKEIQ